MDTGPKQRPAIIPERKMDRVGNKSFMNMDGRYVVALLGDEEAATALRCGRKRNTFFFVLKNDPVSSRRNQF